MDEISKQILNLAGIYFNNIEELDGQIISREQLLCETKYEKVKKIIPDLKNIYSSTFMTCLQKNAEKNQIWPLINLVRQILNCYNYKMIPIRKSDGYTLDKVKKYKRFFKLERK